MLSLVSVRFLNILFNIPLKSVKYEAIEGLRGYLAFLFLYTIPFCISIIYIIKTGTLVTLSYLIILEKLVLYYFL